LHGYPTDAVTLDFAGRKLHGYPMDADGASLRAGNLQNRSKEGRLIALIDQGYPMDAIRLNPWGQNLLNRLKI
jgi:hypothetical protein